MFRFAASARDQPVIAAAAEFQKTSFPSGPRIAMPSRVPAAIRAARPTPSGLSAEGITSELSHRPRELADTAAVLVTHIQIALGEDIDWQLESPDGVVFLQEPNRNYLLVRGTQAIWLARSAGRSTIKASGGMNCPSGSLCPMLLAVFTATVEVAP